MIVNLSNTNCLLSKGDYALINLAMDVVASSKIMKDIFEPKLRNSIRRWVIFTDTNTNHQIDPSTKYRDHNIRTDLYLDISCRMSAKSVLAAQSAGIPQPGGERDDKSARSQRPQEKHRFEL